MVFTDLSNPFLRHYLVHRFRQYHVERLRSICGNLKEWAAQARRDEEKRCASAQQRAEAQQRPLAVVLDIDEVLLCNFHMNSWVESPGANAPPAEFHAADYFSGPDGRPWPRGSRLNPALPGVVPLLGEIRRLKLEMFLVTGRLESIRNETVENFEHLGMADAQGQSFFRSGDLATPAAGRLHMCPDAEEPKPGESIRPFKESRRREIERTHRIVANIGDQVSDLGLHGDVQVHLPHPFYFTP